MIRRIISALAALSMAMPLWADGTAGAYLAGRSAAVNSDYADAARYYTEALARDTANADLMESAALAYLSLGRVERALPIARRMEDQGQKSLVAHLVISANLAASEEYEELLARETGTAGLGPWVDGLVKAWAHLGDGDVTKALAGFDELAKEQGIGGFVMYHKALALASVGDFESAEEIFASDGAGAAGQTRRGTIAHAEVLAQLGKFEDAVVLMETAFADGTDPELDQLIARYKNGEVGPFDHVRGAKDGIAEVFFTFAAVLLSEGAGDYYVLLYARIAGFLRPDEVDVVLLTAELLESAGQFDLAIEEYKTVAADHPGYHAAELGRAGALRRSDRVAQAIEVLELNPRHFGGHHIANVLQARDVGVG